jgi:hypothetical protein
MDIPQWDIPQWLWKIAGPAATAGPAAVSWGPLPVSAFPPGKSVDDGLRALFRRAPQAALTTWRHVIKNGTNNPEPFLFSSLLMRVSRDWLEYTKPSPFDRSVFAEAVLLSQKACVLDQNWPDAWFSLGEWLEVAALAEGIRRTVGMENSFRLDDILQEFHVFGLAVECLCKASELDDGRLEGPIASFAHSMLDHTARSRVLDSAGRRATDATVRRPAELLWRCGVDANHVRPIPSDAALMEEVTAIHNQGEFLIFIPSHRRFNHFSQMFAARGLRCDPEHAFGPVHRLDRWYAQALRDRIAFVSSGAVAVHPWDWFRDNVTQSRTILYVGVDEFSLLELLGILTWTSPDIAQEPRTHRTWYINLKPA